MPNRNEKTERNRAMVEAILRGEPRKDIAKANGISVDTVNGVFNRYRLYAIREQSAAKVLLRFGDVHKKVL